MTQPRVLCVMLANGRQQMVDRAVRCFHEQIYPNRILAVLDSGEKPVLVTRRAGIQVTRLEPDGRQRSIGELRNLANALCIPNEAELIAHWDSDDWSHPLRLTEQVELLQSSGAQVTGYREMLFWDSMWKEFSGAWLYSMGKPSYCLGTSLMYTRKVWERHPFDHRHTGEDTTWLHKVKSVVTASAVSDEPRMIASIHGDNTCARIDPDRKVWRRAPEFDEVCRETMRL